MKRKQEGVSFMYKLCDVKLEILNMDASSSNGYDGRYVYMHINGGIYFYQILSGEDEQYTLSLLREISSTMQKHIKEEISCDKAMVDYLLCLRLLEPSFLADMEMVPNIAKGIPSDYFFACKKFWEPFDNDTVLCERVNDVVYIHHTREGKFMIEGVSEKEFLANYYIVDEPIDSRFISSYLVTVFEGEAFYKVLMSILERYEAVFDSISREEVKRALSDDLIPYESAVEELKAFVIEAGGGETRPVKTLNRVRQFFLFLEEYFDNDDWNILDIITRLKTVKRN